MINIIKMGQIPQTPCRYKTTCNFCSTIFEHDETDCKIAFLPSGVSTKQVTCPLCESKIQPTVKSSYFIQLEDLPKPPPPRSLKPKNTIYELVSDYITIAKKSFKFKP